MPSLGILAGFTALAILLAFAVFWVMRRYFPHVTGGANNDVAGVTIGIVGGIYGILLAFVIVALWSEFDHAGSVVTTESSGLSSFVWDVTIFPQEPRAEIMAAVKEYVHAVREDEWISMQDGESSPRAFTAFGQIYDRLQAFRSDDPAVQAFYSDAVARLNDVNQARRERVDIAKTTIPGSLLFMIFAGAAVIIVLMSVMGSQNNRLQVTMLFAVTGIIAFNLALAVMLDYPFSGDVAVSSHPFAEGVLAQFFE